MLQNPCTCTCATPCFDCITSSTIDENAGCCHGHPEAVIFRYERPYDSRFGRAFGSNPFGDPPECPGGCERACTVTREAAPAVQVVYPYEQLYFRLDSLAIETDRPPRCNPCFPDLDECCGPFFFGCVCDPAATLSPYQKFAMAGVPQYQWLLEIICHGGGECFPPVIGVLSGECVEIPGPSTLYRQLLGAVHVEHWYKISECRAAIDPPLTYDGEDVQFDCIGPRRWLYACSGAPLFQFDLHDAVAREIITGTELCEAIVAASEGRSPEQGLLRRLWDAGYIRIKDWRPEAVAELAELKERFPTAYAGCTLPESCGDLEYLGPVRKRWWDCLKAGEVSDEAESLQLPAECRADPWDGGPYPTEGDPDWEDFVFWRDRQWVYFHARPAGWSWICFDPGVPDADAPDLPRLYSASCPDNWCLNVSGWPREETTTSGPYAGVNFAGEVTCPVDCDADPDPYGCTYFDTACADDPGDGSKCVNLGIAASCEGLHFVHSEVCIEQVPVSECYPSGGRFWCCYVNHGYVFTIRRPCGGWDDEACLACRKLAVPVAVSDLVPDVFKAGVALSSHCNQYRNCPDDPICCGLVCVSLVACEEPDIIGAACEASPGFEDRESQAKCYP